MTKRLSWSLRVGLVLAVAGAASAQVVVDRLLPGAPADGLAVGILLFRRARRARA